MKWLTVAIAVISLSWIAFGVVAQSSRQPEGLVPLPEYTEPIAQDGMPGPDSGLDPSLEPEVTITEGKDETVEEYRVNGQLYMIKITPKIGKPYFLLNRNRAGESPHRGNMESGVSVPMWEIYRF
ncbi:MAG: DUF2782 domain-containing protein [Nitrosomonas sp.]|jgi:hypothetical protein|nr:DUF2782 domain-containing protein [Nitrosomonas sp.]MCC7135068.1 DUF2782 domain-containing protein [Nitrosomonas sp.]